MIKAVLGLGYFLVLNDYEVKITKEVAKNLYQLNKNIEIRFEVKSENR